MPSFLSMLPVVGMLSAIPVVALLIKATLLLAVALAAAAALRRASASARHLLWVGVLAALVLLPLLSRWVPWRIGVLPPPAAVAAVSHAAAPPALRHTEAADPAGPALMAPGEPRANAAATVYEPDALRPAATPSGSEQATLKSRSPDAGAARAAGDPGVAASDAVTTATGTSSTPSGVLLHKGWLVLLALWAAGALAILARLAIGAVAVRRIVRSARALDNAGWRTPLWEVADRMGLADVPALVQSERVSMPFACGLFHPIVVLPPEAERWSDERRRAVLCHELAHVRRRDLLGHTLGRVACALYWFHPLAWTAARRLRMESECACDDLVLSAGTRASEYADHLLQIVTAVRAAAAPIAALPMARRSEFEGRMLAILDPGRSRRVPGRVQSGAMVVALAGIAISVSAMAPSSERPGRNGGTVTDSVVGASAHQHADTVAGATAARRGCTAGSRMRCERPRRIGDGTPPARDARPMAPASDSARAALRQTLTVASAMDAPDGVAADTGERMGDVIAQSVDSIVSAVGDIAPMVTTVVSGAVVPAVNEAMQEVLDGSHSFHREMDAQSRAALRDLRRSLKADRHTWRSRSATGPDSTALAALVHVLGTDSSATVRKSAAWALGRSGSSDPQVLAALGTALQRDASPDVRNMAAWGLGESEDSAAVPALAAALSDSSAKVRGLAAWALGQIEPPHAPPRLVAALRDADTEVRSRAAWALGQIQDSATVTALSTALRSEQDSGVQRMEAWALLRMGNVSQSALLELLKSPDPEIRARATRALVGYGTGGWSMPMPMPRPMP